jgi:Zn-dependent protease
MWFVVFLFACALHESAHAWTSNRFGDPTARYQGRITLNPLPHIDPIGTILFPLIGFMGGAAFFGWAKPTPTNPLLWRDKVKAGIWVAAAGPISNFIIAAGALIVIKVLLAAGILKFPTLGAGYFDVVVPVASQTVIIEPLAKLLSIALILNVTLGVFNLVPIPPLDGSHIFEVVLPYEMAQSYAQIRPFGFLLLFAFLMTPVFGWILSPFFSVVVFLLRL